MKRVVGVNTRWNIPETRGYDIRNYGRGRGWGMDPNGSKGTQRAAAFEPRGPMGSPALATRG